MKPASNPSLLAAAVAVSTIVSGGTELCADGSTAGSAQRVIQPAGQAAPRPTTHYGPGMPWQHPPYDRPGALVRLPPVDNLPASYATPQQHSQVMPTTAIPTSMPVNYGPPTMMPASYAGPATLAPTNHLPAPPPSASTQAIQAPPPAVVATSQPVSAPASESKAENPFALSKFKSPFAEPDPRYIPEKVASPRWYERIMRR